MRVIAADQAWPSCTFGLVSRDKGCRVDLEGIRRVSSDIGAFLYVCNRIISCPEYQATDFSVWRALGVFVHLRQQRS